MRVLTTTICYPTVDKPEQGLFVQRRAAAMAERGGMDVQVVAPQPWCPLLRKAPCLADEQWPVRATFPRMPSVPVLGWAADGVAFGRTLELYILEPGGPSALDVIDSHFVYPDGVGAWLAGRKLGLPVVVTVRGKIVSLSRKALRRAQIARMLRGVDARIAVSRSLAGWVHRVGGSDLDVDVLPNGIECATFQPLDRAEARRDLDWNPNARYLLAVGHLQRVKGFDRIVSILPEIRARMGDVRLVLAGSNRGEWSFRRRLSRLIAACGGAPAVTFVGPVDPERLNLLYNAADLFVNVSRSEGWNNAIAESLAAGTPAVAFDVGGNTEQICSRKLGRIVPDGDLHALADAVCESLEGDWNRVLIAAHGGARSWDQVGREVRRVFDRVLQARASARTEWPGRLFGLPLSPAEVLSSRPRGLALEVQR
jgi:glycosyltransferase involved in cell wall biosynthesis